jgi:hypothetical protein
MSHTIAQPIKATAAAAISIEVMSLAEDNVPLRASCIPYATLMQDPGVACRRAATGGAGQHESTATAELAKGMS